MFDIEMLKNYLRIDGSEDDDLLTSFVSAAEGHLQNAGVQEPEDGPSREQYHLAIMLYVKREYDPLTDIELERIQKAIEGIILQLKDWRVE